MDNGVFYYRVMRRSGADGIANCVDPDHRSSLIWIYSVCLNTEDHNDNNWAASWQNQQNGPAKTQISLGIRPVWSESSLCAQWVAKDPRFLHADSEDSD